MSFGRKKLFFAISAAALGSAAVLPMATGLAFESDAPASTGADAELIAASGIEAPVATAAAVAEPTIVLDAERVEAAAPAPVETAAADAADEDLICLAKAVRHEAGNQSRDGQLAVAQVIMNRVNSPLFPNSICDVIHQRGQFFDTRSYHPSRSDAQWQSAMEVALDARDGTSGPVVGDALFFHADYVSPPFFRSRQRVTQLGDHIFYR